VENTHDHVQSNQNKGGEWGNLAPVWVVAYRW
jgi:hypothetical protein